MPLLLFRWLIRLWIGWIGGDNRCWCLKVKKHAGRLLLIICELTTYCIIELTLLAETRLDILPTRKTNFVIARAWPVFFDLLEHRSHLAHMAMSSAGVDQVREDHPE